MSDWAPPWKHLMHTNPELQTDLQVSCHRCVFVGCKHCCRLQTLVMWQESCDVRMRSEMGKSMFVGESNMIVRFVYWVTESFGDGTGVGHLTAVKLMETNILDFPAFMFREINHFLYLCLMYL
ncbi:hypothetical protein KC19_5G135100 [Ceratodon purpureus]|uniref:Uncharacterized protein n=1 Tax=Ceratodon purpureus TaxID=3225 RepID=A0A8T0I113_CERPU|nr:hypothetical protein KC19_5G135100 [Ceratodon purpureus]